MGPSTYVGGFFVPTLEAAAFVRLVNFYLVDADE